MIRIINEGSSQLVNELVDTSPCESVEDVFQHSIERNRVLKAGEYIESWEASSDASVISSGNLFAHLLWSCILFNVQVKFMECPSSRPGTRIDNTTITLGTLVTLVHTAAVKL